MLEGFAPSVALWRGLGAVHLLCRHTSPHQRRNLPSFVVSAASETEGLQGAPERAAEGGEPAKAKKRRGRSEVSDIE